MKEGTPLLVSLTCKVHALVNVLDLTLTGIEYGASVMSLAWYLLLDCVLWMIVCSYVGLATVLWLSWWPSSCDLKKSTKCITIELFLDYLSSLYFASVFFLLTIVIITNTITITRTPLTTPTSIPPIHWPPLVHVLLLSV